MNGPQERGSAVGPPGVHVDPLLEQRADRGLVLFGGSRHEPEVRGGSGDRARCRKECGESPEEQQAAHGGTHHLSPPRPVWVRRLARVFSAQSYACPSGLSSAAAQRPSSRAVIRGLAAERDFEQHSTLSSCRPNTDVALRTRWRIGCSIRRHVPGCNQLCGIWGILERALSRRAEARDETIGPVAVDPRRGCESGRSKSERVHRRLEPGGGQHGRTHPWTGPGGPADESRSQTTSSRSAHIRRRRRSTGAASRLRSTVNAPAR